MNIKKEFFKQKENFESDGQPFLVRCPICKAENYGPIVITGCCAWCGWDSLETLG